jgi:hypothetical protein
MHVRISDQKMKDVLCLINSIPLPQKSPALPPERQVIGSNRNAKFPFSESDNCRVVVESLV